MLFSIFLFLFYFKKYRTTQNGVNKPRFINSTGAKSKDTPLASASATVSASTSNATVYSTPVEKKMDNKPVFNNSKGERNNNIPLNPDAKVENKKDETIKDVKDKIANTKNLFQRTLESNSKVKAPVKDYLEADNEVKYKEEIEISKPVFQSKKGTDESNFIVINNKEDVITFKYNNFFRNSL